VHTPPNHHPIIAIMSGKNVATTRQMRSSAKKNAIGTAELDPSESTKDTLPTASATVARNCDGPLCTKKLGSRAVTHAKYRTGRFCSPGCADKRLQQIVTEAVSAPPRQ